MIKGVGKLALIVSIMSFVSTFATAEAAQVIDAKVNVAIEEFNKEKGAIDFLSKAYAYLVFPTVVKGGFGIGGEYGNGALRVDGKTVAYYNVSAA